MSKYSLLQYLKNPKNGPNRRAGARYWAPGALKRGTLSHFLTSIVAKPAQVGAISKAQTKIAKALQSVKVLVNWGPFEDFFGKKVSPC